MLLIGLTNRPLIGPMGEIDNCQIVKFKLSLKLSDIPKIYPPIVCHGAWNFYSIGIRHYAHKILRNDHEYILA